MGNTPTIYNIDAPTSNTPNGTTTDDNGAGNLPNYVPGIDSQGNITQGGQVMFDQSSGDDSDDSDDSDDGLSSDDDGGLVPTAPLNGLVYGSDTTDTSTLPRTIARPGTPGHINTGKAYGYRHFTFVLNNQVTGGVISLDLNFNPEDLSYETPYRVNPIQTFGGIFIDVWGQGIRKIIIRGHTGWRTVQTPTQQQDGFDNLFSLRDIIIEQYFSGREKASQTMSQADVQENITLTMIDRLHEVAYDVVPESFRLMRNRNRPLLLMYDASFLIQDEVTANSPAPVTQQAQQLQNQQTAGILGALASQFGVLGAIAAGIGGSFGNAMTALTTMGGGISGTFQGILTAKQQFTQGINGVTVLATQATQAVNSGLGIIAATVDFSQLAIDAKALYYDVKSVFAELNCILNQIEDGGLFIYTGIVGSSYCGTLAGGTLSPLIGTPNTFATLQNPNGTSNLSTITAATQGINPTSQQLSQNINAIDGPALLVNRNGNYSRIFYNSNFC
jgi:hypothetical protein